MFFELLFADEADHQLDQLEKDQSKAKQLRSVRKTLGLMEVNLRHPSLNTHKYKSIEGPNGLPVFESYAENKTPGSYRVFWCYGPKKNQLTILSILPHP